LSSGGFFNIMIPQHPGTALTIVRGCWRENEVPVMLAQRKKLVMSVLVGVGLMGGAMTMRPPPVEPLLLEVPAPAASVTAAPSPTAEPVVVFVSGAVIAPGVYTLPPGSRVVDALLAAGGPAEGAAVERLNQATRLSDGMQIHMPTQGEPAAAPAVDLSGETAAPGTVGPVSLNRGDAATLESLPGIGPALAARVIEYREANGPFQSVEQLLEVKGIGPAILDKIRDLVVVD
jgi:competence protein ComEA